jgi:hypothetical protein
MRMKLNKEILLIPSNADRMKAMGLTAGLLAIGVDKGSFDFAGSLI